MVSSLFAFCQIHFDFLELHFLSQQTQLLLMFPPWKVWYSPLCVNWMISNSTLMHSNRCCMWLIWTNHIISSCNLVLLLELLHLLQRCLSDQAYKLFQCNFILLYAIVQTVKISVTILTDFYLLPYQNAIIQWRSFDKNICTNFNWILLLKSKQNYSSLQNTHFNEKLSI